MTWFLIALNDIKITLREKMAFVWSFAVPIVFIVFFGILMREKEPAKPFVVIDNRDEVDIIEKSLSVLFKEEGIGIIEASKRQREPIVLIPRGTAVNLMDGKKARIEFHLQDEETFRDVLILLKLQNALMSMAMSIEPEQYEKKLSEEDIKKLLTIEPMITLQERDLGKRVMKIPAGVQHSVPASVVMFLFINLFTYFAAYLVVEREMGHMRRMKVAPVPAWHILIGKISSRLFWNLLQMIILITFSVLVFGFKWGNDPIALIVFIFAFGLSSASMGVYFSTLFSNPNKCAGLGSLIVIIMAALGGCWWPLEVVPQYLRYVAYILPTGWAMDGFAKIMSFGYALPEVLSNIIIFIILSIICIYLSARRFNPV